MFSKHSEPYVVVACLARDCGSTLKNNIASLFNALDNLGNGFMIYILENDSIDNTAEQLRDAQINSKGRVSVVFLRGLDDKFPSRQSRIAYCREYLLNTVKELHKASSVFISIDLDSRIAYSIDPVAFKKAINYVVSGKFDAVFPISKPYYYDLIALRAFNWSLSDPWILMGNIKPKGHTLPLLLQMLLVYPRQKSSKKLQEMAFIPVDSAYGGLGIYRMPLPPNSTYIHGSSQDARECEHINFNNFFKRKSLVTEFVVEAPPEHISLRVEPVSHLLFLLVWGLCQDLYSLMSRLRRCISSLIPKALG